MRCTKCSFISFDDLAACAKCATDLSLLAKELNGTCRETKPEFFLGSAIQTGGLEEDTFSDSQMLPPIDHSDMNFDDTSTGGFAPLAASSAAAGLGFDDSVGVSGGEDDVAIELGDIMPIDLDQLDAASVLPEVSLEKTDSMPSAGFAAASDKTDAIAAPAGDDFDFDFSDGLSEPGSELKFDDDLSGLDIDDSSLDLSDSLAAGSGSRFDQTMLDSSGEETEGTGFELDQELLDQLADSGDGVLDETVSLDVAGGFDRTSVAPLELADDGSAPLELDESLVAELAGTTSTMDFSGDFPVEFSDDSSASGGFGLDEALVAELADEAGEPSAVAGDAAALSPEGSSVFDDLPAVDLSGVEAERDDAAVSAPVTFEQIEDLTGEFPPIREDDESELASLDLADIDVSDLVDHSSASEDDQALSSLGALGELSGPLSVSVDDTLRDGQVPLPSGQDSFLSADGGGVAGLDSMAEVELDDLVLEDDTASPAMIAAAPPVVSSEEELSSVEEEVSLNDAFDDFALTVDGDAEASDGEVLSLPGDLPPADLSFELDDAEGVEPSLAGIDGPMSLDDDMEVFLGKQSVGDDDLPEIELISDDEDDLPPELPS